jgi:DNA-binding NarL/FixJ family response regulator
VIRIAIIDDHALVRAGLCRFFGEQPDFEVVAEAADGRQALEIVRSAVADVIVLDIAMPGQNGVDTLAAIRARAPALPVLMLSAHPEAHYATTLLRLGASAYLNKEGDPAEIVAAVRALAGGRRYVSAETALRLADGLASGHVGAAHEQLSERELQVLLRLAGGQTVGQLALGLSLSVKTVSTYRSRVMVKMGLSSNSELTHYALRHGLIR